MTRRRLLLLATLSALSAVGFALVVAQRPSDVARVQTLGTVTPPTLAPVAVRPSNTTPRLPSVTSTTVVAAVGAPTDLVIDRIALDAPVVPVGVETGTNRMQIPDIEHVGWYRYGPSPGENGSAVLVGHIDGQGRPGVFWRLRDLVPGDRVTVGYAGGTRRTFRVTGRRETPKQDLPTDLFSRAGPPRLALITCGGSFDRRTGHYRDNVFVVATAE